MGRSIVERIREATPQGFAEKWGPGGTSDRLNERAGAQLHFIDLCHLLGVSTPDDPDDYCFERGLWGIEGGNRYADVWKRGHFAWEYKAPGGDLKNALAQLMKYALPLENPPLLIVSDRHTIQIHTHFTGHPSVRFDIRGEDLRQPSTRALLRSVFESPDQFRPRLTSQTLTAELAGSFARIADALRKRGTQPMTAAHFLTQCVFCCYAEDALVLPDYVFRRVVQKKQAPSSLRRRLTELFGRMQTGGDFGVDSIPWFNGGLFAAIDVPLLNEGEIAILAQAAESSWESIDPSILGTLFERGLDPSKRNQLGMHYTDAATIERLVDPVVRRPLLHEWDLIKRDIAGLLSRRDFMSVRAKGVPSSTKKLLARHGAIKAHASRAHNKANELLSGFLDRLRNFRVLDPACGSGNFLFLALKALKDIEERVNLDAEELGLQRQLPVTGPQNVMGIEVNEYAAELARATVWIGELQWRKQHGYGWKENPILDPLDQIERRDALLDELGGEARWPAADVIVGNPPFVGVGRKRRELGNAYVEDLNRTFAPRIPGASDLVCYWFDKALRSIDAGTLKRAGLVATNSVRGGASRTVLDRISLESRIFEAWADEPWVNNGAAVRVSLICFGDGIGARLNGRNVVRIHSDLTASLAAETDADLTTAKQLSSNLNASFQGASKKAKFEIDASVARIWLRQPNPNGKSNSDVLKPWANGFELSRRPQEQWIVDFGTEMSVEDAALYELPFAYISKHVRPDRLRNNREAYRKFWWRFAEPRPGLRKAIAPLSRFIATIAHSKHRFFVWLPVTISPDQALITIARADDVTFGVLHSRFHELWALRTGSSLEDRPRYTPTTTFETFPFPEGLTPVDTAHQQTEELQDGTRLPADLQTSVRQSAVAIAVAARRLVSLRDTWINPSELTTRGSEVVPLGMRQSPYPNCVTPRPGCERDLAKRTMTNLYNERPAWLARVHEELDAAVAAAYGWKGYSPEMSDEEILRRLLALNHERALEQSGAQRTLPLRLDGPVGLVSAPETSNSESALSASDSNKGKRSNRPRARKAA